ncbi:hypothetical protein [Bifidobacterium sp. UTCIF-39]|uniref:hypothetical protein n=1 Tax=Bifidobacterium sp. UTCIF-39 TaxID=1465359 RepID=UPI00112CC946|nr:hypothetical protein [Bifidobacterium sp. UTCIF-39]
MTIEVGLRPLEGAYATAEGREAMRMDDAEITELRRRFRANRRTQGIRQADIDWFRDPFDVWHRWLVNGLVEVAPEALMKLCVGMNETLAMRDAIILAPMTGVSKDDLFELVTNPHSESSSALVCNTLTRGFEDPSLSPNPQRCQRSIDALAYMITLAPEDYGAQPLAALAYLLWWVGRDDQSLACSLRALYVDDSCTMATILLGVVQRDIHPAWIHAAKRE